jgi:sec-independent protein translocase protein TatA
VTKLGGLQPWHWVIVIAVFVLLFGAKKLPDAARSLGKSMRIFKSEIKEMQSDSKPDAAAPLPPSNPIASERVDHSPPAAGTDVAAEAAPNAEQPTDKHPA